MHYRRAMRGADYLPPRTRRMPNEKWTLADLMRRTRRRGDCIEWIGKRVVRGGYGHVRERGVDMYAHRLAWELAHGPILDGMCVLHRCDNPPCLNINHLWLGTGVDNMRDASLKNRIAKGSRNGSAKLDEVGVGIVRRLVSEGVPRRKVAESFGVSVSTISSIVNGKSWAWLKS